MKLLKKLVSVFLVMQVIASCVGSTASCWEFRKRQFVKKGSHRPKISVIVPVYNTGPWLRNCLDSIINQTLKNIEIICINDGSTDNSGDILREYAKRDRRIKVLTQENKGGAAARNAGLKVAKGEYISFVDSDDMIYENAYEITYNKIKEADADILIFSGEIDRYVSPNKIYNNGFDLLRERKELSVVPWNKLYKREFLRSNNLKFPENARVCHDEAFNAVVFPKAQTIVCIENVLYHHERGRAGSLQTSSNRKMKAESLLNVVDFVCNEWRRNGYVTDHVDWLLKKMISLFYNHVFKHEEGLSAQEKRYYTKALLELLSSDIYNSEVIEKYDKRTQQLISELRKAANPSRHIPIKKLATLLHYKSERI